MDLKKNYAEVLIDGKVYTLGGVEEASYFQQVAAYVNQKLGELRRQPGFLKQKEDYQLVMLEINMADDYFKAREEADLLRRQTEETERDMYGIKHELINAQMKLETAQNRIRELEEALDRAVLSGMPGNEEEHSVREAVSLQADGGNIRRVRRGSGGAVNFARAEEMPSGDQEDDRQNLGENAQSERVAEEETAAALQPEAAAAEPEEEPVAEEPEKESASAEAEEARRAREEEEKRKALAAARAATEQLLKSRAMQIQSQMINRGHQNKKK